MLWRQYQQQARKKRGGGGEKERKERERKKEVGKKNKANHIRVDDKRKDIWSKKKGPDRAAFSRVEKVRQRRLIGEKYHVRFISPKK